MPKINQTVIKEVINESGEMVSKVANRTLSWGAEPSYIKLYLQDILYLSDMPTKRYAVLYELLKRASYAGEKDGMQVVINASLKRRIAETLGFKSVGTVSNTITDFVKGKILYRVDTGMYNFNPWLFGKGDWQDIARLRLEVDYDEIKGKTFKAVCSYKSKKTEPLPGQVAFYDDQTVEEPQKNAI